MWQNIAMTDIRKIRESRGETLTEAASKIGRSISWLSRAERRLLPSIGADDLFLLSVWAGATVKAEDVLADSSYDHPSKLRIDSPFSKPCSS